MNEYDKVIYEIQKKLVEHDNLLGKFDIKPHNHPILETKIDKLQQEVDYLRTRIDGIPTLRPEEPEKPTGIKEFISKLFK